ncbi:tetratricopeptide repeat protein 14 homolog isoform X2 [Eupeodes corollae]|uniref:tetratricopeptide repeat protein 14 homolog isoform X2 n=1 Tax=Eupeodes corollae TaxID=290404 RepID=UPI00248FFFD8|nr:tetratricopeptide repeat protein 14 homolog isoform X2 [Eupeodes corollae]
MNSEFIAKSLKFHGQPLQKIWAGERGDHDLYQLGITNPDFSVYFERQKNLTFQDRAKRLKLHQFLARNAERLYSRELQSASVNTGSETTTGSRQDATDKIVPLPPYEYFLNTAGQEKSKVCHSTLDAVKPGHIVYGIVTKTTATAILVKVLCTREPLVRYLADINVKAHVPNNFMVPGYDEKGNPKNYAANVFVCCEVLDISVDADRMTLGMKRVLTKDTSAPLGLILPEQIPDYYRRIISESSDSYMDYLRSSKVFHNTNCYEILYQEVGLDINDTFSHMASLKHRYPTQDYAIELRQTQASKWAFRSVADGIEHFKIGRHVEAFQCLNKALSIDPRNVEGLVARGALYANKGSFVKAVEDFETALKLNSFHTNARKYMGETLVALGRSYEEENKMEEAVKAYQNCLNIIPNHEQARISLDALMRRPGLGGPLIDINMLSIPGSSDLKKKKKSKHKSSSSSSSSEDSSDSSSGSDSSDDSSDSGDDKQKKKNRKQKSLSPLSKRMGDMNSGSVGSSGFEFSQPFHLIQKDSQTDYNEMDDFLGAGADDDYETRVQKLIKEASKHKKLREGKSSTSSSKAKKSKKKKKKAKKEAARLEKKSKREAFQQETVFPKPPPMDAIALNNSLEKYERSIMELNAFQKPPPAKATMEIIDLDNEEPPPAPSFNRAVKPRAESPIPPAPKSSKISIKIQNPGPSSSASSSARGAQVPPPPTTAINSSSAAQNRSSRFMPGMKEQENNSFKPFPIKGPVVLDKFGCFRLATVPATDNLADQRDKMHIYSRTNIHCRSSSRSLSRSRSRGRSRRKSKSLTRHRSKSSDRNGVKGRSRRSRSRSRSPRSRRTRRRSRSRSRSRGRRPSRGGRRRSPPTRRRSKTRSRSRGRRRSPSPFNPNRRPRPGSPIRRRRGNSPDDRKGSFGDSTPKKVFGNRVWQRPVDNSKQSRWGEKLDNKDNPSASSSSSSAPAPAAAAGASASKAPSGIDGRWKHDKFVKEDGISLEEIDKIITQAKKERKEEILQRDKKILKKNPTNNFL